MLRLLHDVDEKYKKKHIYIWHTNKESLDVLAKLVLSRIKVVGFVTEESEYVGKTILCIPVFSLNECINDPQCVVIVNEFYKSVLKYKDTICIVQLKDIYSFRLSGKKVHIFGAGDYSDIVLRQLNLNNVDIDSYIVSSDNEKKIKNDKMVNVYKRENYSEDDVIVIGVKKEEALSEIYEVLDDCICDIYTDIIWTDAGIHNGNLMLVIEKALKEERKVYLCANNSIHSQYIKAVFEEFGIVMNQINVEGDCGISSIWDVDEIKDSTVIVDEFDKQRRWYFLEILYSLGFKLKDLNFAAIQEYTLGKDFFNGKIRYVADPLISYSYVFHDTTNSLWSICGDENDSSYKIMVLGGSTTHDGYYSIKSWARRLWERLNNKNKKCTFYIGAQSGAKVADELFILLRDGYYIKPDLVISFSGTNDMLDTDLNRFNEWRWYEFLRNEMEEKEINTGLVRDEGAYHYWKRIQKIIKDYSESIGAKYLGILQPNNFYMENMSLSEKMMFEREIYLESSKDFFIKSQNDMEMILNLFSIFHHVNGMYIDFCHYSEDGVDRILDSVEEKVLMMLFEQF
ncbi:hypothetical protein SAMN04487928_11945 [Butyrivibrio proteoclasticus]|uniref:SGNH hydrolase-type esterase domain-containing protein n=1 Tax=Butyrivibrio proteoclasticus TaxID=43305 RepID=A0A1I5VWC6_9FIRM|nr:SGNH/GDSL hydrolase family protein [Butyrivibrio proteoclasticus]SFQ11587.1 hypothetical protein SAMN04487928_11945 [Butyrivibrio proteoclasticus]